MRALGYDDDIDSGMNAPRQGSHATTATYLRPGTRPNLIIRMLRADAKLRGRNNL